MVIDAVVVCISFMSLGNLVSMGETVSILFQSSTVAFTPWGSWPALEELLLLQRLSCWWL